MHVNPQMAAASEQTCGPRSASQTFRLTRLQTSAIPGDSLLPDAQSPGTVVDMLCDVYLQMHIRSIIYLGSAAAMVHVYVYICTPCMHACTP